MSLTELLPSVRSLSHPDKVRLLGVIAEELAREEGLPEIRAGASYPIWSPYGAFDAAKTLLEALAAEGKKLCTVRSSLTHS
jgi:hypothetical protein